MKELSEDLIAELLETKAKFPAPEQKGPLRWFDNSSRCAARGCSSPTFLKLRGISYCTMHTLRHMNEMLIKYGA